MGLLMRFYYLLPLKAVNYAFLLHAHSHVAMLGWVYLMIYVLVVHFFIPKEKSSKQIYNYLFWITEFTVVGMMIAFPIQGYALYSIVFSTLHILLSYIFCWLVWKDSVKDRSFSHKLLLTAILFMILSTFGIWCLGPAVKMLGKQSSFYQIAIQFFLHFQFNGWFLFAILALFLKQFKTKVSERNNRIFYVLLITATFLTVAFPVSWYVKNDLLNWINNLGILLQLGAFIYFYKMLKSQINSLRAVLDPAAKLVYSMALCSLVLKIGIQLLVLLPYVGEVSHQIRSFVIGFIHLTTLGIITGFLFGILIQNKLLSGSCFMIRSGIKCFVFGYLITEIILFLQGVFFYLGKGTLAGYYEIIFGSSVFIVIGLSLIFVSLLKTKKQESIN